MHSQWLRAKVERFDEKANRPGLRGWMVRRFYRSPLQYDPDALELAQVDLGAHAVTRTITPALPGERA